MNSDVPKEIIVREIKISIMSNENYKYFSQQEMYYKKIIQKIILDNLYFTQERILRKVFANTLTAYLQKRDVLHIVKFVLKDLVLVIYWRTVYHLQMKYRRRHPQIRYLVFTLQETLFIGKMFIVKLNV